MDGPPRAIFCEYEDGPLSHLVKMTVKVEIILTSGTDGCFQPGQEVVGEVIVVLTKTIKVSRKNLQPIKKCLPSDGNRQNLVYCRTEAYS